MNASAAAGVFSFVAWNTHSNPKNTILATLHASAEKIPDDFLFLSAVAGLLIYVSRIPIGVSYGSIDVSRLSIDVKEMNGKGRRMRATP